MKGRRRFLVVAICGATIVWANWLGPVVSGAILLLAPAPGKPKTTTFHAATCLFIRGQSISPPGFTRVRTRISSCRGRRRSCFAARTYPGIVFRGTSASAQLTTASSISGATACCFNGSSSFSRPGRVSVSSVRRGASRSSMPCMSTTPRLADGCTLDWAGWAIAELCGGPTES
jgi:hypothetical protein